MGFAILLEVVGRARVDTTGFDSLDAARSHIRSTHVGYAPKSPSLAASQIASNPHYVEVWARHGKAQQDIAIVAVDSDGEFVDAPA